jgi:hypothetical protein
MYGGFVPSFSKRGMTNEHHINMVEYSSESSNDEEVDMYSQMELGV